MKAFASWRLKVWDRRLAVYRKAWNQATAEGLAADPYPAAVRPAVYNDQYWERLVTQALMKRTAWRKRAGVRR